MVKEISDKQKDDQKTLLRISMFIIVLAILNLASLVAPTWLFIGTLLSITLFAYENYAKSTKPYAIIIISIIFVIIGATIHIYTTFDAMLMGVDPLNCEEFLPIGVFTGGCGPEPLSNPLPRLNDTLALLALAATILIKVRKSK